jgi:hypothetical protein
MNFLRLLEMIVNDKIIVNWAEWEKAIWSKI